MDQATLAISSNPSDWILFLALFLSEQGKEDRPRWSDVLGHLIMMGPQRPEDFDSEDPTIPLSDLPGYNERVHALLRHYNCVPQLRKALLRDMRKPLRVFDGAVFRNATPEEISSLPETELWTGMTTLAYAKKLLDFLSPNPKGWGFDSKA